MADLTQTISNSVNCFAMGPSTLWGSGNMTWGTSKWGEGTNQMPMKIGSVVAESETPTNDFPVKVTTSYSESETPSSDFPTNAGPLLDGGSLAPTYDNLNEYLQSGNGYFFVFTDPVTNAESRVIASYTCGTAGSSSWTSQAVGSQSWSETSDA